MSINTIFFIPSGCRLDRESNMGFDRYRLSVVVWQHLGLGGVWRVSVRNVSVVVYGALFQEFNYKAGGGSWGWDSHVRISHREQPVYELKQRNYHTERSFKWVITEKPPCREVLYISMQRGPLHQIDDKHSLSISWTRWP